MVGLTHGDYGFAMGNRGKTFLARREQYMSSVVTCYGSCICRNELLPGGNGRMGCGSLPSGKCMRVGDCDDPKGAKDHLGQTRTRTVIY